MDGDDKEILREVCTFNKAATEREINLVERELGIKIPNDYRDFLLLHNGMTLFSTYLVEYKFFSLDEIRENFWVVQADYKEYELELTKDYPIGEYPDVGYIMINDALVTKYSSQGAIYVGHILPEETEESFVSFIENVIKKTGEFFWEDQSLTEY